MRAPANEATGTAGQSYVKAQFEELGWGAVANPEHDLGTDLWLMARDARRFDLKRLIGAQVKSGPSYFAEQKVDDTGEIEGWWFRESDDSHFDYWQDHSVPHIIVLHDIDDKKSYWVHVTSDRLVSTGKGKKILVPKSACIDADHIGDLIGIATGGAPRPAWEGSAWENPSPVPESARLRYALITPRLMAPHPNKSANEIDAYQAIAMVVQCRLTDLARRRQGGKVIDLTAAHDSLDWAWRMAAAVYDWVAKGDLDALDRCLSSAEAAWQRAAALSCVSLARIESGDVERAAAELQSEVERDESEPVDHAWLQAQLALCRYELGDLSTARDLALAVQGAPASASSDPTASAIGAAAAYTVFSLSNWSGDNLARLIQSHDTAATWWRSQALATGLGRHFEDSFRRWSLDQTIVIGGQDEAWAKMRSAMLLAGLAADGSAWRHAASLLARRGLMQSKGQDSPVWALELLRLAGQTKSIRLASQRMLTLGPIGPLVELGRELRLECSTRTSLEADLAFVQASADVLSSEDCDRHAAWALAVLRDPRGLRERLSPSFLLEEAVVKMLRELVQTVSTEMRRSIVDHLLELPPIEDQSLAGAYGGIFARIPDEEWSERDVDALSSRPAGDNFELRDAIDEVVAAKDPSFRQSLLERIRDRDLGALASYGDVTDLPAEVAQAVIDHHVEMADRQTAMAIESSYAIGSHDVLGTLILMNVCHADKASWGPVVAALAEPRSSGQHIKGSLLRLSHFAGCVPQEIRDQILASLDRLAKQVPPELPMWKSGDVRAEATAALVALFPERLTDTLLRELIVGDEANRKAAANIILTQKLVDHLNVLAAFCADPSLEVRAATAEGLASWVGSGVAVDASTQLLDALLREDGVRLGVRISRALVDEETETSALAPLIHRLKEHPSAVVRARVRMAQEIRRT